MKPIKKTLSYAALIVIFNTVLSRISGYLREALIPGKLGTGDVGDAYNIAFQLPDLMYNLLLGGAIAAAVIPILSGYIAKKNEDEGWIGLSTFINVMFLFMVTFCILGMIFAPQLLNIVYPGFAGKSEAFQSLTIRLTRILFPSVSFLMLAGFCNGVLNSYQRFTAAAFGPVLYNIGGILSLAVFGSNSEKGATFVASGVMISSFIYFIVQLSVSFKNIKLYRFILSLKNNGFIRIMKLAIPSMISSAVVQVNLIISATFTSLSAAGSVTIYNTANKTWQLPLGIFAQSMGIALLPTMSAKYAIGEINEYKKCIIKGLKMVSFFAIPSAVAIVVIAEPIVRTLFKFSDVMYPEAKIIKTGLILALFSVALIAQSFVAIMARAFYAVNDTKTPLYIGIATIIINYISCYMFYYFTSLDIAGMALAYSISSTFNALMLLLILELRIKKIGYRELINFIFKIAISSALMGGGLYFLDLILVVDVNNKLIQITYLGIEIVVGVGIFILATLILKVEESKAFLELFSNKFQKLVKKLPTK